RPATLFAASGHRTAVATERRGPGDLVESPQLLARRHVPENERVRFGIERRESAPVRAHDKIMRVAKLAALELQAGKRAPLELRRAQAVSLGLTLQQQIAPFPRCMLAVRTVVEELERLAGFPELNRLLDLGDFVGIVE